MEILLPYYILCAVKMYFLRPEKKGAFDFKNLKLKKYFSNLCKLN